MKTLKTTLRSNSRTEPVNMNGSQHHMNGSTQFLSDPLFANGYHDLLTKRENGSNLPSDSSNSMTITRLMEEKLVLEALRKARYDIEDPTHRLLLVNGEFKELFPSNDWNAPELDLFQLSESSEDSEGETGNSSIAPYQIGFKSHLLSDPRYVDNRRYLSSKMNKTSANLLRKMTKARELSSKLRKEPQKEKEPSEKVPKPPANCEKLNSRLF